MYGKCILSCNDLVLGPNYCLFGVTEYRWDNLEFNALYPNGLTDALSIEYGVIKRAVSGIIYCVKSRGDDIVETFDGVFYVNLEFV